MFFVVFNFLRINFAPLYLLTKCNFVCLSKGSLSRFRNYRSLRAHNSPGLIHTVMPLNNVLSHRSRTSPYRFCCFNKFHISLITPKIPVQQQVEEKPKTFSALPKDKNTPKTMWRELKLRGRKAGTH
uniref:(northern house mosquito) hypothetical protein n=1 Tax=Culex pipiens TaxID=7175 RepID=A0A8D8AEV5_CULPI